MKFLLVLFTVMLFAACSTAKLTAQNNKGSNTVIKTGAEQTEKYIGYLKRKRVAILANQTSIIGNTHLVDSLQKIGINIVKYLAPNTGFGVKQVPAMP